MTSPTSKPIAVWFGIITLMVAALTVFGALVRLTGSGLSMVEWNILMGVIPPISTADWMVAFGKYQAFPEYKLLNSDMTLGEFKFIFLMEYGHRMLARSVGLVVFFPFLWFYFKKKITPIMSIYVVVLFAMGGLQGVIGWFMVSSGLVNVPYVSHLRLTLHLAMAMIIIAMSSWLCLRHIFVGRDLSADREKIQKLQPWVMGLLIAMFFQLCLGGMVAGSKAGFVANTFPLIEGELFPPHLWGYVPWYTNFIDNLFLLNFLHRWAGVLLAGVVIYICIRGLRSISQPFIRRGFYVAMLLVCIQVLLGIATLVMHVPISLGSLHQAVGMILWCSVVYLRFCVSGAPCLNLT